MRTQVCFPIQLTHFLLSHLISISSLSLLKGAPILFNTSHLSTSKLFSNWVERVVSKQTGQPGASPPCSTSLGTVPMLATWGTALPTLRFPPAAAAALWQPTVPQQWLLGGDTAPLRGIEEQSVQKVLFFFSTLHFLSGKAIKWTFTFSLNDIIQQLINFLWPLHRKISKP